MLPATIPLFPLPDVVLFPTVFLPLHIFEPRYRDMVRDALGERPHHRHDAAEAGLRGRLRGATARSTTIGCAGLITHHERLADGRYNIVLRGLERFRVHGEDDSRAVPPRPRRVAARRIADARARAAARGTAPPRDAAGAARRGLASRRSPPNLPDDHLVNALVAVPRPRAHRAPGPARARRACWRAAGRWSNCWR